MKLKFLSLAILLNMLCFAIPSEAVFYGICCPAECPEGQEAKETETDVCKCECKEGDTLQIDNKGNAICCDGATNLSTGQIDQRCCEREAIGGVYVTKGAQGIEDVCCKKDSSKTIEGTFETMCCIKAGGAEVSKGKCCRQAPQGS